MGITSTRNPIEIPIILREIPRVWCEKILKPPTLLGASAAQKKSDMLGLVSLGLGLGWHHGEDVMGTLGMVK